MASVRKVPRVRATSVRRLISSPAPFEPTKKDLMISKIISRAACLRELVSNPKSFSNCPDLHGGVPGLARDKIRLKPAVGKKRSARRQFAVLVP